MEDNTIDSTDDLQKEIEDSKNLVLYAYSKWIKGDYKPTDQAREDLVNIEVNFRIAGSVLDYEQHGKLSQFRQECLVALGM